MKHWFVPGFLAVIVLAAALRLPELRLRPLHNDEGVNAIKFRALWVENNYKYDANEFHGPTLPYFTLPAAWLNSSRDFNNFSEATFRLVTAVFGLGLVLVLLLLTPGLGKAETFWAGLFAALSPAMVYYSRDYIHEMLLLFFTALAATAWWRHVQSRRIGWCVLAGAALGLMAATKETFVFALLSFGLAAIGAAGWKQVRGGMKSMAIVFGVAAVVSIIFFSSFFTNLSGIADAIKTYVPWFHRAEGVSPHVHPWYFYFERLFFFRAGGGPMWSEGLIGALAVVGFAASLSPRARVLARFIAFYTASMTLIYTFLPYKTPWCLIEFYFGMILLAGMGAAALVRWWHQPLLKAGMAAVLLVAAAQLGWQARLENFGFDKGGVPYCDSVKNPYVYSQTTPDIFRLMQTVEGLARASQAGYATPVEVMASESYWPLPWYLRRFTQAGYWDKIPGQALAPIMIVAADLHAGFDERPARTHLMAGYFELRPNVFYELYVNIELWTKYIKTAPPERD